MSYVDPALRAHDIEQLAAIIRKVDGDHTLGAGALAEVLIDSGVRLTLEAWLDNDPAT